MTQAAPKAARISAAARKATAKGAKAEAAKAAAPKLAALVTHAAAVTFTEGRAVSGKLAAAEAVTAAFLYLCQAPDVLAAIVADGRPAVWIDWRGTIAKAAGADVAERWASDTRKYAALRLKVSPAAVKADVANGKDGKADGVDLKALKAGAARAIAAAREAGGFEAAATAEAHAMLAKYGTASGLRNAFATAHGKATGGGKVSAPVKAEADPIAPLAAPVAKTAAATIADAAVAIGDLAARFGADDVKGASKHILALVQAAVALASDNALRLSIPRLVSDELARRDVAAEAAPAPVATGKGAQAAPANPATRGKVRKVSAAVAKAEAAAALVKAEAAAAVKAEAAALKAKAAAPAAPTPVTAERAAAMAAREQAAIAAARKAEAAKAEAARKVQAAA